MKKNNKIERPRWWSAQRSYYYESHDADGNFNGVTEEEWKKKILEELDAARLKAYHSTIIFHNKDTEIDSHGSESDKGLHAHVCVWFINGHTQTSAMKALGATRLKNVKEIKKNKKSSAYRYLLHATDKAIKDGKYIYGEQELFVSKSSPDIKYDYHKLIQKSEEDEEKEDIKEARKKLLKEILEGNYDREKAWNCDGSPSLEKIIASDMKIAHLIGSSCSYRREVENAIKARQAIIQHGE